MRKGGIICRFFFDGKLLAERAWHALPLEGELVMLSPQPGKEALKAYKVIGRIFMGDGAPHNAQLVNLYLVEKEV